MANRKFTPIPNDLPSRFWERFDSHTRWAGECLEWVGTGQGVPVGGKQYGCMWLPRPHKGLVMSHRLAWVRAKGAIPAGMCVLHSCDNPRCVNPSHLFLGTNMDNVADRQRKGRNRPPVGERNGSAKLANAQVVRMRFLLANGIPNKLVAVAYGVSTCTVSQIKTRRNWGWLT